MKGIAHFCAGVAIATFFPEVVQGAAHNLSFWPLLGGLAGLLPDTLDFKFVRYFSRLDEEVDPARIITERGDPDPQAMAGRIAAAMNRAYEGGREVRLHLHTLRLGADLWRQYSLSFDQTQNGVVVRVGPAVTTALLPYPGSEPAGLEPGRAQVIAPILSTYSGETQIDIFSGPSLAFRRVGDAVEVTFLPWHRAWTHSLAMVLLLGALGFVVDPVCGLVTALAVLAHIVADQLGFMGSNLFFPVSRKRTVGLGWFRSGDALPNLVVVWASLAAILLNLDRFSAGPTIPPLPYVLGVIVAPMLLLMVLGALPSLRVLHPMPTAFRRFGPAVMASIEALDETREVDI